MSPENVPMKNTRLVPKTVGLQNGTQKKPAPKTPSDSVRVGVWALNSTEFAETAPPEDAESLFNGPPSESVIGGDGRKLVPRKHLMPGGKYRAIVKLFLRFAGQPAGSSWAMATGWLIENDLLVTAGHCAYDWSHNYGKLTHVKAYVGYTGKDSVTNSSRVQLRMGVRVAATESWLTKGATISRGDVAFIRLEKPFTGVVPIQYSPTPSSASNTRIGVVGYPGDLMKKSTKEKGALMYEMFLPTDFTLSNAKAKMLQYNIDTYGGNSGSPVLRHSDMKSIGVHVLGGNPNSASVIEGKYGNSFAALKKAIMTDMPLSTTKISPTVISYLTVPKMSTVLKTNGVSKESTTPIGQSESGSESASAAGDDQFKESQLSGDAQLEDFQKAFKKARSVTASPFGAMAAYGLYVSGMSVRQIRGNEAMEAESGADAAKSTDESEDAEKLRSGAFGDEAGDEAGDELNDEEEDGEALDQDELDEDEMGGDEADTAEAAYDGVAERAMLIDAAFDALVQLGYERCKKLGYLKTIVPYVSKHSRGCSRAGRVVLPHLMAPMFRTALRGLSTKAEAIDTEADTDAKGVSYTFEDAATVAFGPRLAPNKEAVIEALLSSNSESFDPYETQVDEVISKGLRISGPLIASVVSSDLAEVFEAAELSMTITNESDLEAALQDENSTEYLVDALAQRALLGEAMLESIMNAPVDSQLQEGIFSSIRNAVKSLGKGVVSVFNSPVVKTVAPWVGIGMAAYTISKDIYKAAKPKKKKEFTDGDETEAQQDDQAESKEADGWEDFFA